MPQRTAFTGRLVASLFSFGFLYVATVILLAWARIPFLWTGVIAASVATAVSIVLWERGRWDLGFFVAPRLAVPDFLRGLLWGFLLISACAALIVAFTGVRPATGNGFPWREGFVLFVPAVIHEELLFAATRSRRSCAGTGTSRWPSWRSFSPRCTSATPP